ncbi:hypothetical protein BM1_03104 [Bipolaris maydis]|nr:hypothetical protein BM1_03104 [Bipolaris maydis]KAJ5065844.1 hypothetical protein J3E74DRAFT_286270 [Bipolaris maydis]
MDSVFHGRLLPRRPVLGDVTNRANEGLHSQQRHEKQDNQDKPVSAPMKIPQKDPVVTNASLAVRNDLASPENKRLSAVQARQGRPPNSKRDSEISNASTNTSSSNRRLKTHIGPWQLGRTIGRGGCSRVRLVRHSGTGQYGAAKIISKATAEKVRALSLANLIQSAEQDPTLCHDGKGIPFGLEREICIMKLLDHPNIVRLFDIWENRDELYLIMEFVEGGELFAYIQEQGGLIEIHAVHIFRQIIAALTYCHRINIHHRDLKPENILLDRDTMTVKLVDFGMAALQPVGKKLTTPCGSPHYAAPEVIRTTSYDGAKADVWSCGVILFVLLIGAPPFNYSGDDRYMKHLFRDIAQAKYVMPDNISREAQDLIRKILVPDPKRRISLEEIWNHPFLLKYQQELNFLGDNAHLDHWTGPSPVIAEWMALDRATINRDILRYLRMLWHSEKEESLIQKLISPEPNQEKFFYAALRKYHADQLENYQPSSQYAVAHSNSDHHHSTRHAPTPLEVAELPLRHTKRSQSAYSILNNEHLYSKHSLCETPASEASYDPYRASRQPIIPSPGDIPLSQHVTVHRGRGSRSDRPRPTAALGHRTGSSLRTQTLRNRSKRSYATSRSSSSRSNLSYRAFSAQRNSMSRSSLMTSQWPSSPPVVSRPSGKGKRGVSFSHLRDRRLSAATGSSWQTEVGSCTDYMAHRPHTSIGSYGSAMRNSTIHSNPKSRALAGTDPPRLKLYRRESPTKYIQGEVRKVSMELGKVMEEAFNRSSVGSSVYSVTNTYNNALHYDSPPTSFPNTQSSGGSILTTPPAAKWLSRERPLPPTPAETPNTFVQRRLAETRAEIAQRIMEDEITERYNNLLENLDRLMMPAAIGGKRIVSAPTKSPEHGPLHMIPEEVKIDSRDGSGNLVTHHRVFTDPVRSQGHRVAADQQQTIRVVNGSPNRVAPLNIRKKSGASLDSNKATKETTVAPLPALNSDSIVRPCQDLRYDLPAARLNNDVSVPAKQHPVIRKKKSWFRRNNDEKNNDHDDEENQFTKQSNGLLQISEARYGLDDRTTKDPVPLTNGGNPKCNQKQSDESNGSEFPMRHKDSKPTKGDSTARKGFLALFGKKSKNGKATSPMELNGKRLKGIHVPIPTEIASEVSFSSSSISSNFDLGPDRNKDVVRIAHPEMQMNWLSRFLHIKPTSKTLCLQVGRGKVRQDFVRLLRDWQRFGIQDVALDRKSNSISARVDKNNHLKIKPVSFVIELFVVLEHGRRANLCLARFIQTRGAASSFRKVVDIIEDICRARCMLVEDEQKKASMMEVLD